MSKPQVDPTVVSLTSCVCSGSADYKQNIVSVIELLGQLQQIYTGDNINTGLVAIEKSSLYNQADAPQLCLELAYALKRSIRGCASLKESSRLACSLFFISLLKTFGVIIDKAVLISWFDAQLSLDVIGTGKSKSDSRIRDLAKLHVLCCALQSSFFCSFDESTKQVLVMLTSIRKKKFYFNLPVDSLLVQYIQNAEVQNEVSSFILESIQGDDSILEHSLKISCGHQSRFRELCVDDRSVFEYLPNLHPVLNFVAVNHYDSIKSEVDRLLIQNDSTLQQIGLLLLDAGNPDQLPVAFFSLIDNFDSKKKPPRSMNDAVQSLASKISNRYISRFADLSDSVLVDLPLILFKNLPKTLFTFESNDEVISTVTRVSRCIGGAKLALVISKIISLNSRDNLSEILRHTLYSFDDEFQNEFKRLLSQYASELSRENLEYFSNVILKVFKDQCRIDKSAPIQDYLKSVKKVMKSNDEVARVAAAMVTTVFILNDEPSCFELMNDIENFAKNQSESKELLWSELVLSLLSFDSVMSRKLGELLFIKLFEQNIRVELDLFFEILNAKSSHDQFEADYDEETEILPESASNSSSDFSEDEYDRSLASAVSQHIKFQNSKKSIRKQLQSKNQMMKARVLSCIEIAASSKTIDRNGKFLLLEKVCCSLNKMEPKDENSAKLNGIFKKLIQFCKPEKSLPWKTLSDNVLAFSERSEMFSSMLVTLIGICERHEYSTKDGISEFLKTSLKTNQGLFELQKLISALCNHNLSSILITVVEGNIPLNFGHEVKAFLKFEFLNSLKSIVKKYSSGKIASEFVRIISAELTEAQKKGVVKQSWIKQQEKELEFWGNLAQS